MDAGNENLSRDRSNARKFKLNSKIEVGQKGRTFYSKRGNNVHSGIRQQNV
jgi:hypothetical protein